MHIHHRPVLRNQPSFYQITEGSSLSGNKMGLHKGFSFHDFVSLNVYMYSTLNSLEYHHLHKP